MTPPGGTHEGEIWSGVALARHKVHGGVGLKNILRFVPDDLVQLEENAPICGILADEL